MVRNTWHPMGKKYSDIRVIRGMEDANTVMINLGYDNHTICMGSKTARRIANALLKAAKLANSKD